MKTAAANRPNNIGYNTVILESKKKYKDLKLAERLKYYLEIQQAINRQSRNSFHKKISGIKIEKAKDLISIFTFRTN